MPMNRQNTLKVLEQLKEVLSESRKKTIFPEILIIASTLLSFISASFIHINDYLKDNGIFGSDNYWIFLVATILPFISRFMINTWNKFHNRKRKLMLKVVTVYLDSINQSNFNPHNELS